MFFSHLEVKDATINVAGSTQSMANKEAGATIPTIGSWSLDNITLGYVDEDQDISAHIQSCTGIATTTKNIVNFKCAVELNKQSLEASGQYSLPDALVIPEPHDRILSGVTSTLA